MARGLGEAGLEEAWAYDVHRSTPGRGEKIEARAREIRLRLVDSPRALAERSDLLISVVVADAAVEAARSIASHLSRDHVYADLNSVSPRTKQVIASVVADSGARFVEGAIMAPVPPHAHKVPMLLGGASANLFVERLAPYGMQLEIVSDRVGSAAAVKMCRSVVVKGLEAVLLECVLAAGYYDASERVFDSLAETFPGQDWARLASYMTGRVVAHGHRRAQELDEVARTLEDIGIEPIMARAAARRQYWCADLHLEQFFGDEVPQDYRKVVSAIQQALSRSETFTGEGSSD